ncbi:hypothetical protein FB451DRAFT_1055496 [Mycena latifolia]|nr:hypothetical protein FB451DRAFT_1055496 [Mycena latifolia]
MITYPLWAPTYWDSKNGGKAGPHSWVPTCDTIGSLSYLVVQLYQHSYRRQFRFSDHNYAVLGTLQFSHLPSNSFQALLPEDNDAEEVKTFRDHLKIGACAQKIFEELCEKGSVGKGSYKPQHSAVQGQGQC